MAARSKGHCFRQAQRIRYSWEFASLKNTGERAFSRIMIMNWRPTSERSFSRLGVVVSKRVGCSVVRSRTRRRLREAFRHYQHQISEPIDVILVARKFISKAPKEAVNEELSRLLRRAKVLKSSS